MIPSTLTALVAVLSSLAAVNGAVVQRDGTFTFLTPQPTLGGGMTSSSTSTSASTTSSSAPTTTSTVPTSPSTTASVSSTQSSRPTSSTSMTTSVSVSSPVSTTSTATSSVTASIPVKSSTTPTVTRSVPITQSTAPSVSSTVAITPTPTAGAVNCNGVQGWQAAFAYTAGAQVIFNDQLFTARQWTYNNAPPAHPDQWTLVGTCSQPIINKADCRGVSAWQNNVAYTTGNRVTFQGSLWSAVQWTFANSPGDASGSWQDLGVCA